MLILTSTFLLLLGQTCDSKLGQKCKYVRDCASELETCIGDTCACYGKYKVINGVCKNPDVCQVDSDCKLGLTCQAHECKILENLQETVYTTVTGGVITGSVLIVIGTLIFAGIIYMVVKDRRCAEETETSL